MELIEPIKDLTAFQILKRLIFFVLLIVVAPIILVGVGWLIGGAVGILIGVLTYCGLLLLTN